MDPHFGVHCWREEDGAPGREENVREEIARYSVRCPGQQVSCRGDHDNEVGLLSESHVRNMVRLIPDRVAHRLAGQRLPGRRADESQRCCRGDDGDVMP